MRKLTIEHCYRLAEENGGKCLSDIYIGNSEKYLWQCDICNNKWQATYNNIHTGKWCPECAKKRIADSQKFSIEYCRKLAEERGGKCLSINYINSSEDLDWLCKCGYAWSATYGSIQQGKWCPKCGKKNKTEQKVREILEATLLVSFPSRWFNFNNRRFQIDCYCESLKLGVEYDGEQHYLPASRWYENPEKALIEQQERDRNKDIICKELGITLLRIPYTAKNKLKYYIESLLQSFEVKSGKK